MSDPILRDYLATAHPSHRQTLRNLHDIISDAAPDAELVVRKGVPAFRHRGKPLVSMGDAKRHISLYVMQGRALEVHAAELAGYDSSSTVVRFPPNSPIPEELVARLIRTRIAEIETPRAIDN